MIFPFFFHFLRRRPATCSSFHMGVLPISSADWGEEKLLCKESIFFHKCQAIPSRPSGSLWLCFSVYCRVCESDMVKMCRCCGVCLNAATQHAYKVNLLFYHIIGEMDSNESSLVICSPLHHQVKLTFQVLLEAPPASLSSYKSQGHKGIKWTGLHDFHLYSEQQQPSLCKAQPCRLKTGGFLWNECRAGSCLTNLFPRQATETLINTFSTKWAQIFSLYWN